MDGPCIIGDRDIPEPSPSAPYLWFLRLYIPPPRKRTPMSRDPLRSRMLIPQSVLKESYSDPARLFVPPQEDRHGSDLSHSPLSTLPLASTLILFYFSLPSRQQKKDIVGGSVDIANVTQRSTKGLFN